VTDADIVLKEGASRRGGLRRLFHRDEVKAVVAKVEARTVGEAMSTPAITGDARQSASGMRCERLLAPVLQRWANSTSSELVVWLGRREGGGSQDAADRVQMLPSRACCRASPHENRLFKPKMRAVELEVRAGEGGPVRGTRPRVLVRLLPESTRPAFARNSDKVKVTGPLRPRE
jgi:hypothetical protein